MKKLFTFLFLVVAFTTSFAQYRDQNDDRYVRIETGRNYNNDYNNRRFDNHYTFTEQEKNFQIARINREFDYKADAIRNNMYLRRHEVRRALRDLDEQRQFQIRQVWERFKSSNNQCNSRDYDNRGYGNRDNNWQH